MKSGSGKPTNGQNFWKITALPMCDGQLLVKSLQRVVMSMTSYFWHMKISPYKTQIDKIEVEESSEPIIDCKHPIIASRATPIGSTERAPNEKV
jgi:hypothetical protein